MIRLIFRGRERERERFSKINKPSNMKYSNKFTIKGLMMTLNTSDFDLHGFIRCYQNLGRLRNSVIMGMAWGFQHQAWLNFQLILKTTKSKDEDQREANISSERGVCSGYDWLVTHLTLPQIIWSHLEIHILIVSIHWWLFLQNSQAEQIKSCQIGRIICSRWLLCELLKIIRKLLKICLISQKIVSALDSSEFTICPAKQSQNYLKNSFQVASIVKNKPTLTQSINLCLLLLCMLSISSEQLVRLVNCLFNKLCLNGSMNS